MLFGEIECWNYWILIKSLSICNILFNMCHIWPIRKYLYDRKYQLNVNEFNKFNIYTYSSAYIRYIWRSYYRFFSITINNK